MKKPHSTICKSGQDPVKGTYIMLNSGDRFYPFNPEPNSITIQGIAKSLSQQCRYTGHTDVFYSVAEHSVLLAEYGMLHGYDIETVYALLMHDASEAIVTDLARPIKQDMADYNRIEALVQQFLSKEFEFQYPFPKAVGELDHRICINEVKSLMTNTKLENWGFAPDMQELYGVNPIGLSSTIAEQRFLDLYNYLRDQISKGVGSTLPTEVPAAVFTTINEASDKHFSSMAVPKNESKQESTWATNSTGAQREAMNKANYDLVPYAEFTESYVRVAEYGAQKYASWNWSKGMSRASILRSLLNHAFSYLRGEDNDKDKLNPDGSVLSKGSGLNHVDHILWNATALAHNVHHNLEDGRRAEPPRDYKISAQTKKD